ncbi:Germination protease [Caldalkalibacillus thermarum TA2.A1]|uniref:Germination protease n=1 Tax=Caldalkalibacillus thermarum (strain TA2.A1) TaxID=986075 RepID=F5L8R5_CALTT|nr:GPR endopeptidase [Caldalkalibacillus thermarum]EGL82304.1 Germination protease [Caldalkalibacillus thermarum TA2.A1]QZT33405.1 GPR endopeptidase [Caldalkalibacillus thermarum TA2.A1]
MTDNKQKQHLDLSPYQIRTDLAVEAHQLALEKQAQAEKAEKKDAIDGVRIDEFEEDDIKVIKVHIDTQEAAERVGKQKGRYLTIEAKRLRQKDSDFQDKVTTLMANQFYQFLHEVGISSRASCLVVGLGNWNITPDALGPIVVEHMIVTRHLFKLQPDQVEEGFRPVSALTPGVMGLTGMETSDIIRGVVNETKPDFVVAVDALAARSIERLNTTIQVSDTGIHPGSGVGNKRVGLTRETLGIPVIAVGVPTVVDATSIVSDAIDFLLAHLGKEMRDQQEGTNARRALVPGGMRFGFQKPEDFDPSTIPDEEGRRALLGLVGTLEDQEKRQLIYEVLKPLGHHLIVTPKEVDEFIEDMGNMLANAISAALHEKIDMSNVSAYTH